MKTGLFTGTFDPFTIGHESVVSRALTLFDNIVIGVAVSESKHTREDITARIRHIEAIYAGNDRVRVVQYDDLTVDLAKRMDANCIVRGVRSVKDFEYEREQADINRRLSGIETVFLIAVPELSYVSSSMVRELNFFGKDTSEFLPKTK